MEKTVIKTLIYADIFDYPLKIDEIHRWLISKRVSLIQVEKAINRLIKKRKVSFLKDYYFLPKVQKVVNIRRRRQKYSEKLFQKARYIVMILKIIPWIKLVGISGGLSLNNADKADDIDLLLITSKKRLWLSRLLVILIFDLLGVRRKVNMKTSQISGKFCLNTILEVGNLQQQSKDIYIAHEVLQMRPLWQRDGVYSKYLKDNNWAFSFLPNWTSQIKYAKGKKQNNTYKLLDFCEDFAKRLQLKIMKKPQGMERVEERGLYFYPQDSRLQVLKIFNKQTQGIH